jgi:novobiocin biosynthesis protein NovU/D-mycarose 3-C-methyltransferase
MNHMRRIVSGSGLAEGDLVVEIGSNVGTHLGLFRDAGMRVVGVDPARNLARVASDRGIETIAEPFTARPAAAIVAAHGPARMVLARQCFAHIDDVHEVLNGVTTVLDPDGTLAIEVPYLAELLANDQFDTIFHEHLSYFSLGTLRRLLAGHGLRVTDVWTAAVHGGSIVVFATPRASRQPTRPVVARMLRTEDEMGLSTEQTYRDFAGRTEVARAQIGNLIRSLAADGQVVAGYGAPAKGSTLLNACGLTQAEVPFCTDTTPLKQGRLLPGSRIPVLPPAQGRARRPDYFLLLAWNYADEIIGKEHDFLARGGRFIVPIPRPRVVSAGTAPSAA